jgi:sulfur-oxidizing protein SoxX
MQKKFVIAGAALAAGFVVAGCAGGPGMTTPGHDVVAMLKASFRDQGIAKVDRLNQDEVQAACSSGKPLTEPEAKRIEAMSMATVKWPSNGQYFGDFKAGEKLAQDGSGMTWRDKSADPKENGGNCYNCHEIDRKELSFGTIGTSLWNYGKLRGVKDLNAPASQEVIKYTWAKLWNAKAYSACSNMPRFGHKNLLNEDQLRNLMSLLLDPKSPVNQ